MKKFLLYTLFLGLFALSACEDTTSPILDLKSQAAFQALTKTEFVFNKDNAGDAFPTITWSKADFGVSAVVKYRLTLTNTTSNKSVEVITTGTNSISLTNLEMNKLMAKVGGYPGQTYNFKLSLETIAYTYSYGAATNEITFKATPFDPNAVDWKYAYIAVSYPDWDYTSAYLIGDPENDGTYHGYAYFDNDNVTYAVVDGANVTHKLSSTNGTIATKGFYEITVDGSGNLTQTQVNWGMIGSATSGGWSTDTKMEYDKTTRLWTAVTSLAEGEYKFRANSGWDINFGAVAGHESELTGTVVPGGPNFKITKAHGYIVTLNLTNAGKLTYSLTETNIEQSSVALYLPGDYQGWDPSAASCYTITSAARDFKYSGVYYFPANTHFKFLDGNKWGDPEFGVTGDADVIWTADKSSASFSLVNSGAQNVPIANAGYYRVSVDTKKLTCTFVKSGWEVIGDATPGGWDKGTLMTYDPATKKWSVDVTMVDGAFKFRWDASWTINLGGTAGALTQDGANIAVTAGTYTIVLDPDAKTATVTKK